MLKLVPITDPILRKVAIPVDAVDDVVRAIMDHMLDAMYRYDGTGLAAPQVGIGKRIVVMEVPIDNRPDSPAEVLKIANPEILWVSDEKEPLFQGCLSVPGTEGDVIRPCRIRVTYLDEHNVRQTVEASGLKSHCFQHEIDHLNGILFIDYLSPLKRKMAFKKAQKFELTEA